MRMISLAATPAAFLLPSRSPHVAAGKLALISMIFTTFFLFTAGYHFPGGASHYPDWAEAIVHGTTLPPGVAQREVGFPLLYILSGFTISHSFVGITLILAAFAVLIPVLVYWCLERASPTIAFYTGLVCIISLSPFTYLKFFYPDQAYMFFNLLSVALLIAFLWSGRFQVLYFFTVAALAASFTRTAGNLMFPVLLVIGYLTVRGRFRHYLACALIFALATAAYQWHRYEVFDMRHQASIPSGKGMQILYPAYLYMAEFGVRLSPDMGPNTKFMLDKLREGLQPGTRGSPLIDRALPDDPPEFMEKHVYAYTPEKLFELISTEPNEEYYWIMYNAYDPDDEFHFKVAMEIWRSHPWYIVEYSVRNLWHSLFDPGYSTPRYSTIGWGPMGNDFIPATQGWGVRSEDPVTQYGVRAAREMEYFPLKNQPPAVQRIFAEIENLWQNYYHVYVWTTAVPIMIAWMGVFMGAACWVVPRTGFCRVLKSAGVDKLVGPIIAASALLLYEDLATAMFSQPHYRYFHITEPWRLVVAGFGVAFVMGLLSCVWPTRIAAVGASPAQLKREGVVSAIQKYDLLDSYFGRQRTQWIFWLVVVNAGLFAWWASTMIFALPSEEAMRAMRDGPDAQRLSDMHNLGQALDGYFKDRAAYPATPEAVGCGPNYNNVGNLASSLVPKYIAAIPKDPKPQFCEYNYTYWSDTKNYIVMVRPDNVDSGTYVDRWCIGAFGGSIAATPASRYLPCPTTLVPAN
jgi:hypothetical protein